MPTFTGLRAPLVGRDDELEFLLMRISAALKGKGGMVLIAGEAGIGKTRLCEELESRAIKAGYVVLVGRCLPGSPAAFFPFHDAARSHLSSVAEGGSGRNGVTSLVREMERVFESCSEEGEARFANERIILNYLESLRQLSLAVPVLLRLEDLHWMDSASSLMLQLLARNVREAKVMVMATYRPEDLIPEETGRPHPLTETLELLRKEELVEEIALLPLGADDLRLGMEAMLGGQVEESLAQRIWEESSGNPLYAFETVRLMLKDKGVALIDGYWTSPEGGASYVPSSMKEVLLRRAERLPWEERRLLDSASVMGVRFDPEVLADALGLPPSAVEKALMGIEGEHGLVVRLGGEHYFSHESVRRVLYGEISDLRRRELHRMIGEALERRPSLEDHYGELSLHFREARVSDKCVEYSLRAGGCCLRRYALTEALGFFQTALGAMPLQEGRRMIAQEGCGDALFELRSYEEAYARFDAALEKVADPRDRGRLLRKSGECWWPTRLGRGSKETMLRLFDEAEACPGLDPYDKAEVLSNRAVFAAWDGELSLAADYCDRAEAILEGMRACERLGLELVNHQGVVLSQGRTAQARLISDRITKIYSRFPSLRGELEAIMCAANCLRHTGSREALGQYRIALGMCSRLGDHVEGCWSRIFLSELHELYGEYDLALQEAMQAVREAKRSESSYMLAVSKSMQAVCQVRNGLVHEANNSLDEAVRFVSVVDWKIRTMMHYYLNLAKAEVLMANGDWEAAREFYENALSIAHGGVYGALRESVTRLWYGRSLLTMGRKVEAREHLQASVDLSEMLGNSYIHQEASDRLRLVRTVNGEDSL